MQRKFQNIMVTGCAGFIGANFIHYLFKQSSFTGRVINVDKLTYAGNPENIIEIDKQYGHRRYIFEKVDIKDFDKIKTILKKYNIDAIVHFAAESHVDRSIFGPYEFIQTNIMGTFSLLEGIRVYWKGRS